MSNEHEPPWLLRSQGQNSYVSLHPQSVHLAVFSSAIAPKSAEIYPEACTHDSPAGRSQPGIASRNPQTPFACSPLVCIVAFSLLNELLYAFTVLQESVTLRDNPTSPLKRPENVCDFLHKVSSGRRRTSPSNRQITPTEPRQRQCSAVQRARACPRQVRETRRNRVTSVCIVG